jgi:hypothetical protein
MESKFKIGDTIYYMNYSEPVKGVIKGIAFVIGEFQESSFKRTGLENKPVVIYSTGNYSAIGEDKAFATKEELQADLFKKL